MGAILDHPKTVAAGDGHDLVHAARRAGVMEHVYRPGPWRHPALHVLGRKTEVVDGGNIGENRSGAGEHDRVGAGDEGQRGADHFVARPDAERPVGDM